MEITFKGGLTEPFHRWFRLTPSFSPLLVGEWLDRHPPADGGKVLDPFVGAGTTCIVASSRGLDSIGFEINPFLAFVSRVSSDWTLSPSAMADRGADVLAAARIFVRDLPIDKENFCASLGTTVPALHNIDRWWRPGVLRQLIALRQAIRRLGDAASDYLLLALAQCVYPTAEITLGRLQIAFKDRSLEDIDAFAFFEVAVAAMVGDLRDHKPADPGSVQIINADSRSVAEIEGPIGALFCSPPYPNRYSYVWNTRPHLYLLEFIATAKAAADIDCDTIGGTWGRATSVLKQGVVEPAPHVEAAMGPVLDKLLGLDLLMRNYVCKYFNDLDQHLAAVRAKLAVGAPVGYVVGNTETKGVMVETQEVLASLLHLNGFSSVDIESLRTRNSGVGLVEATVSGRAV